jgi:hypothetical protein
MISDRRGQDNEMFSNIIAPHSRPQSIKVIFAHCFCPAASFFSFIFKQFSKMKRITALVYFSLFALGLSLPTFQPIDGELQGRADSPSYFAEYHECDPKQVEKINWAYEDALKLVDIPAQLNLAVQDSFSWCGAGICAAGTLEKRFFGEDIDSRPEAYELIQSKSLIQIPFFHRIAS